MSKSRNILIATFLFFFGLSFYTLRAQIYPDDFAFDSTDLVNRSQPKVLRYLEIGGSANAYSGDLSAYSSWTSAFHAALQFNGGHRFDSRVGLSAGFLTGQNRFYNVENNFLGANVPNTFFRSNILTLAYELRYNILKKPHYVWYISQGVGLIRFTVKDEEGQDLADQAQTRVEGEAFNNFSIFLPTGMGAAYYLNNGYGVGLHASILNTQTDFLDNIAQRGVKSGSDNVLQVKFFILVPLQWRPIRQLPPRSRETYSH